MEKKSYPEILHNICVEFGHGEKSRVQEYSSGRKSKREQRRVESRSKIKIIDGKKIVNKCVSGLSGLPTTPTTLLWWCLMSKKPKDVQTSITSDSQWKDISQECPIIRAFSSFALRGAYPVSQYMCCLQFQKSTVNCGANASVSSRWYEQNEQNAHILCPVTRH